MEAKKKGNRQGRKSYFGMPMTIITIRLPSDLKEKVMHLGGADFVRQVLAKEILQ